MSPAIYRKYRPKLFADLLGQEFISEVLREAGKQKKLFHAYLFSGPRGTGKTTTARIIAKIANCQNLSPEGEPCNTCKFCIDIDEGKCMDVIEIDAASNRGIDEIRDLKESVRTSPIETKFKVFIIDEAHMLTTPAFNALLKTMEEPPAYVIFILATTEIEKIPSTIASRAQQFQFNRPSVKKIAEKLKKIAKNEKIKISDDACELIGAHAEGSFRDAESLLDQLIAMGKKEISSENVEHAIGKVGFEKLSLFAEYVLEKNIEKAIEMLTFINDQGYHLQQFTKDLIIYFRRVAVLSVSNNMEKIIGQELTERHLEKLSHQAKSFKENDLEILKALITAYGQMRYSQFPIIPLEVALIESVKKIKN